jgi:alpha-galactosidase
MSLWAILAAPLLAGNDLSRMTPETLAILANRDVIAVDQDTLGRQGDRVWASKAEEIWIRPLSDGSVAIGVFNRGVESVTVKLPFSSLGLHGTPIARDLWAGRELGRLQNGYSLTVPRHGVVMLRVTP